MDYKTLSLWLENPGEDLVPRASLAGPCTVDVAILGGGFSGLWTAYYLLSQDPSLDVAVIEKEVCGYGASGRNGGWVSPRFPLNPAVMTERFGAAATRAQILAMHDTVEEVGRVIEKEGIDAQYRRVELLSIARGDGQLATLKASHAAYEVIGLGDHNHLVDAAAVEERVRVRDARAAILTPGAAMIQPARLARGLASAVERLGGTIYEKTEAIGVEPGASPRIVCTSGAVTARKAVVMAGEAYLAKLPGYGRDVLPMSSMIVATQPLSEAQWQAIGWAGHEGLSSQVASVDYLSRTADGRIIYGTRGAPYLLGSRSPDNAADLGSEFENMKKALVDWFPALEGIGFSHQWSGYLGVSRDWAPNIYFDRDTRIAGLYGYTGRGVPNTNMAARLVSGLITGRQTGLESLPANGLRSPRWEPEPLRWIGARYVQNALGRIDRAVAAGKPAPLDARLARHFTRH